MNDLQKTYEYLNLALKSLPEKNKNITIKNMISKTLTEVEKTQKKARNTLKNVRNFEEEWKEKAAKIASELKNPQASIDAIEKLIEMETDKINNLNKNSDTKLDIILD